MTVAEKVSSWLPKKQRSLKQFPLAYLPEKYANDISKTKCKTRFEINYSEVKQDKVNENNCENLIFIKSAIGFNSQYISFTSKSQSHTEAIFANLVKEWREENRGVSSTNQMCMHPAYQQIIGMGEPVIPLLLRELEKKSGRWFWALKSISREDPVPPEYRGNTKEMTKAWLDWGRNRGYRW